MKPELLFKATNKLGLTISEYTNRLRDKRGIFAYDLSTVILVAKRYPYGNIVSIHSIAVLSAYRQRKKILMYIDNSDRFYLFSPKEIIDNHWVNLRNGSEMMNFDISLGKPSLPSTNISKLRWYGGFKDLKT